MKIEFKNVDSVIDGITKQKDLKAVLLYGDDNSSVMRKFKKIVDSFTAIGYEVNDISLDSLRENETFLTEEFFSTSMFASNTIYTLRLLERENSYTKYLENLFEKNDVSGVDNFLLVTAGGLEVSSSLRKYAEKSKLIACIGCYEEESKNISFLVNKKLKEYGFNFAYDVVEYIVDNVGNNALVVENEINKIDLYKGDDKNLTLEDVKNCVVDVSKASIEDFCNNFCMLDMGETFRNLDKLLRENVNVIVIIRSLVRYFLQLQKIRFLVDSGENVDTVLKNEKIFWKQQNTMKLHLKKWNLQKINNFLEMLLNVEKNIKFKQNKNIELENFILKSILYFAKNQ